MSHGIDSYWAERGRFQRRLALCTTAVSLGCALLFLGQAAVRWARGERPLPRILRFGFEGPTQYVQRITLEQYRSAGPTRPPLVSSSIQIQSLKGGSSPLARRSATRGEAQSLRAGPRRPGLSDTTLVVHSVRRRPNVPLVLSEELVIERLVRPIYPEEAIEKGIQGRVQIQALVDTTGKVVEVQVFASTGEPLLEHTSESAVWQCRFRPYREQGRSREVYALFRFNFRIY